MTDLQTPENVVSKPQQETPKIITPGDAILILIEAVEIAQNKGGVYTLEDAELLSVAKRVLKSLLVPKDQVNTVESTNTESTNTESSI